MRAALQRAREAGHDVVACAVLVPEPMPDWSTDEILAVHFRMHKAEGVLFPDAILRAAESAGLPVIAIRERQLSKIAESSLRSTLEKLNETIAMIGRTVGPPW